MDDMREDEPLEGEDLCDSDVEGGAPSFDLPPEPLVTEASLEEQVIEEDTTYFNYMLKRSNNLWQMNLDAEDYCKLANTTMKLLEMRRRMMLMKTEPPKDTKGGGKGSYFGAFSDRQ